MDIEMRITFRQILKYQCVEKRDRIKLALW